MLCGDLNGEEIQQRGDIHIRVAGSLSHTNYTGTNYTEATTALKNKYMPIIKKKDKIASSIVFFL